MARPCAGRWRSWGCLVKKTRRAIEQDRPDIVAARAAWRAESATLDPRRLIFLDESGIDTRMTRAYARAAPGERAVGKVPRGGATGSA